LYVDPKTRTWFILRYKYKTGLPIIGFGYALLDFLNTGTLSKETLIFSSVFIAAGLLAKIMISEKIKIKGKKKTGHYPLITPLGVILIIFFMEVSNDVLCALSL